MAYSPSSGNAIVDTMGQFSFAQNYTALDVIPQNWYKTIRSKKGRPFISAIRLLSEITYWYRPQVLHDKQTGKEKWLPRFKGHMYSCSYKQFSEKLNVSRACIAYSLKYLEELGVIKRHVKREKSVVADTVKWSTTLYIELVPSVWKALTKCESDTIPTALNEQVSSNDDPTIDQLETQDKTKEYDDVTDKIDNLAPISAGYKKEQLKSAVSKACDTHQCVPSDLVDAYSMYLSNRDFWPNNNIDKRYKYALPWTENFDLVRRCLTKVEKDREEELKAKLMAKEQAMPKDVLAQIVDITCGYSGNARDWFATVCGQLVVIQGNPANEVEARKMLAAQLKRDGA